MTNVRELTVAAPGSIGNLGPGLDVLGCAITGASDDVTLTWSDVDGITIADSGHPELPRDPTKHTSALAAREVIARARTRGVDMPHSGVVLKLKKGLPLSGGQGGSAASAVAGAVAMNELLGAPLGQNELMLACLEAEATVAGRHLDNVAPILLGGIVVVRSVEPLDVVSLSVPNALRIALVRPAQQLRTAEARAVLPREIPRAIVIHQMAQVAAIVAACASHDLQLLGRAMDDRIAEPARAALIPGFFEAKRAALETGALGVSISGAGPTMFALCADDASAERVVAAMRAAFRALGIQSDGRVASIDRQGARVVSRRNGS